MRHYPRVTGPQVTDSIQEDFMATANAPIKILTVDDHPLLREGMATIINSQPDMTVVGEAASGKEAIEAFRRLRPSITLMDLRLPDITGIEVLIAIQGE